MARSLAVPSRPAGEGQVVERRAVVEVAREGRFAGKFVTARAPAAAVEGAEPLRAFFRDVALPYLRAGRASGSPLRFPDQVRARFRELDRLIPEPARHLVRDLHDLCDQRRQLDFQVCLHYWMHNWVWVHLPLSTVLLLMTAAHAVAAIRFW